MSSSKSLARHSGASTAAPATRARAGRLSANPSAQVDAALAEWQALPWGQVMDDVLQMWLDQIAQGQRTGLALVDSQMRLWQDMQANATRLWAGSAPEDLHVTPDSAGPALCPPLDFTPTGLTRSTLGTLQALSAAWASAVQHELQDLEETSRTRH